MNYNKWLEKYDVQIYLSFSEITLVLSNGGYLRFPGRMYAGFLSDAEPIDLLHCISKKLTEDQSFYMACQIAITTKLSRFVDAVVFLNELIECLENDESYSF